MSDWSEFDAGLGQMGEGIRAAHAAFDAADAGFIRVLEGLKAITKARGTLDSRMTEMQTRMAEMHDTIARLETLVLSQVDEIKALGERLDRNGR